MRRGARGLLGAACLGQSGSADERREKRWPRSPARASAAETAAVPGKGVSGRVLPTRGLSLNPGPYARSHAAHTSLSPHGRRARLTPATQPCRTAPMRAPGECFLSALFPNTKPRPPDSSVPHSRARPRRATPPTPLREPHRWLDRRLLPITTLPHTHHLPDRALPARSPLGNAPCREASPSEGTGLGARVTTL